VKKKHERFFDPQALAENLKASGPPKGQARESKIPTEMFDAAEDTMRVHGSRYFLGLCASIRADVDRLIAEADTTDGLALGEARAYARLLRRLDGERKTAERLVNGR
jgi:hypothetical protein